MRFLLIRNNYFDIPLRLSSCKNVIGFDVITFLRYFAPSAPISQSISDSYYYSQQNISRTCSSANCSPLIISSRCFTPSRNFSFPIHKFVLIDFTLQIIYFLHCFSTNHEKWKSRMEIAGIPYYFIIQSSSRTLPPNPTLALKWNIASGELNWP